MWIANVVTEWIVQQNELFNQKLSSGGNLREELNWDVHCTSCCVAKVDIFSALKYNHKKRR